MTARDHPTASTELSGRTSNQVGLYSSVFTAIITILTFGFAIMAALILAGDYFIQFSVVPVSLMSGETEGITLLTQYNAHGIFIVLEELGYLLMSLSFVLIAPGV